MKENSIEENIEILEKFKNNEMQRDKLERDGRCGGWKIGDIYKCLELDNAIDNILSDYKRVLKENEKIRNGRNRLFEYATAQQTTPEMLNKILREDYISIQKVKDKQKEKEWALESYDCDEADYKQSQAIGAWQVLQELLESEEK